MTNLMFCNSTIISVTLVLGNGALPNKVMLFVVFNMPLVLVFLGRPLATLVRGGSRIVPGRGKVFIMRKLFRVFRILLDCFSGALSFIHVKTFTIDRTTVVRIILVLTNTRDKGLG